MVTLIVVFLNLRMSPGVDLAPSAHYSRSGAILDLRNDAHWASLWDSRPGRLRYESAFARQAVEQAR